jgi:hypothetical protein
MTLIIHMRQPLVAVAILALSTNAFGQGMLREWAREKAQRDPSGTVNIPAPPGDYDTKSLDELVRESVLVVTGRLVRKGSHLNSIEDRVLTDYDISDVVVIRGNLSVPNSRVPGQTILPIVTFWGGEVVVEGVRISATNQNFKTIQDGGHYLLFLRSARPPGIGRYETYNGAIFEVASQQVQPLLKRGNEVFAWATDLPLAELLSRIRSAGAR